MSKKSYNPFRMWGSYVIPIGAILFLLFAGIGANSFEFQPMDWGLLGFSIIGGFLIGWGIHSLFRKLK